MMRKVLLLALFLVTGLNSCKKDNFDPAKQAEKDEKIIQDFIAFHQLNAVRDVNGMYYVISDAGTGNVVYKSTTPITAKYTGRFLNGQVFDSGTFKESIPLSSLILGWQLGIPLIQKGGKIRLIIPSGLAYGNNVIGAIPANSVLDFDIELTNVN